MEKDDLGQCLSSMEKSLKKRRAALLDRMAENLRSLEGKKMTPTNGIDFVRPRQKHWLETWEENGTDNS